jgi:hypothetical protein
MGGGYRGANMPRTEMARRPPKAENRARQFVAKRAWTKTAAIGLGDFVVRVSPDLLDRPRLTRSAQRGWKSICPAFKRRDAQGNAPLRRPRTDIRPPLGNLNDNSTVIQPLSNPAPTIGNFNQSPTVLQPPHQPSFNRLPTTSPVRPWVCPSFVRFSSVVRPTFCRTHSPTPHPLFTYSAPNNHPATLLTSIFHPQRLSVRGPVRHASAASQHHSVGSPPRQSSGRTANDAVLGIRGDAEQSLATCPCTRQEAR